MRLCGNNVTISQSRSAEVSLSSVIIRIYSWTDSNYGQLLREIRFNELSYYFVAELLHSRPFYGDYTGHRVRGWTGRAQLLIRDRSYL